MDSAFQQGYKKILLEAISKHMKNKTVTSNSKHPFIKDKISAISLPPLMRLLAQWAQEKK